jgi:hypothetical protein
MGSSSRISGKDARSIVWMIFAVSFSILVECDQDGANLETGDNLEILLLLRCSAQREDAQRLACMSQVRDGSLVPFYLHACQTESSVAVPF